jgi:effector-binding domain-containing protein
VDLVPIGRLSKTTRPSVKAPRCHDEIGLPVPAHVDPSSRYRSSHLTQVNRAEAVRVLRPVGRPLDELRAVLDTDDTELLHKHFLVQRERPAGRERTLAYLERLIQPKEGIMPYDIQITEVASQMVAAARVHTTLSRIGDDIRGGFGKLMAAMSREGVSPSGAPLIVYPDLIDDETGGGLEICVPIAADFVGDTEVYARELEGGTMAATVHHGPYELIGPAYEALTGWISEHSHETAGPPRETYLNDPETVAPEELLTRVEYPICSQGA